MKKSMILSLALISWMNIVWAYADIPQTIARGTVADLQAVLNNSNINTPINGLTPLFYAIRFNSLEKVQALITIGADVSYQVSTQAHTTPLLFAMRLGASPSIVQALVDAGANVTTPDSNGSTPLHYAVRFSFNPRALLAVNFLLILQPILSRSKQKAQTKMHAIIKG